MDFTVVALMLAGWVALLFVSGLHRGIIVSAGLGFFATIVAFFTTVESGQIGFLTVLSYVFFMWPISTSTFFSAHLIGAAIRWVIMSPEPVKA